MNNNLIVTDELTKRIRLRVRSWAGSITKKANQNLGNKRSLIAIQSTVTEENGKVGVDVVATSVNPLKPVARAYEYGSGINSRLSKKSPKQLSAKGYILIKPKNKKLLAFPWDVLDLTMEMFGYEGVKEQMQYSGKFVGPAEQDDESGRQRWLFKYVEHPGVEAANKGKGYLGPAMRDVRKGIRKEIAKDTRDAILSTFRKTFRR